MKPQCVTVIIPVYNRPVLLKEAVDSVLRQSYRNFEIIIVDDGSTDNSGVIAQELARNYTETIRVFQQKNSGAGVARETGRQKAKGEYIQYLDSDDRLLPNKFEVQVKALREHPECGIAYGYTRLVDYDGNPISEKPRKWTGREFRELFPALLVDRWWSTHTPLFRRSVCDQIGPWSDMRMSEDWEYDARAGALRTKLVHCPEFLSETRHHNEGRITHKSHDRPLTIAGDMARLIVSLFNSAIEAGVSADCGEMRHFSRWAFLVARQAGEAGLVFEAKQCYSIAEAATGSNGIGLSMMAYRFGASILGWQHMGRFSSIFDRLIQLRPGRHTLKQSWMA